MADMLIRLYALPPADTAAPGLVLRKPIGPEADVVVDWVRATFGAGWASEARVALGNRPATLVVATDTEGLAGFCAFDATARGFVGPIGVRPSAQRGGIGAALLRAALQDMRAAGYGYAVAGAVGAPGFFARVAGATEIAGSAPGLYAGLLRPQP